MQQTDKGDSISILKIHFLETSPS